VSHDHEPAGQRCSLDGHHRAQGAVGLGAVDADELRVRLEEVANEIGGPGCLGGRSEDALHDAGHMEVREAFEDRALESAPSQLDARVPERGGEEKHLSALGQEPAHDLRARAAQQVVVGADVEEAPARIPRCGAKLVRAGLQPGDGRVQRLGDPADPRGGRQVDGLGVHRQVPGGIALGQAGELVDERQRVAGGEGLHGARDLVQRTVDRDDRGPAHDERSADHPESRSGHQVPCRLMTDVEQRRGNEQEPRDQDHAEDGGQQPGTAERPNVASTRPWVPDPDDLVRSCPERHHNLHPACEREAGRASQCCSQRPRRSYQNSRHPRRDN
jgi:hypothetical protein